MIEEPTTATGFINRASLRLGSARAMVTAEIGAYDERADYLLGIDFLIESAERDIEAAHALAARKLA